MDKFVSPVARLYLVAALFALSGCEAVVGLFTHSTWSSSLVSLPLAYGLIMRRPLMRTLALWYLGIYLFGVPAYALFSVLSGQHFSFVGPVWFGSSVVSVVLMACTFLLLSLAAFVFLRQRAVRDLFPPWPDPHGA